MTETGDNRGRTPSSRRRFPRTLVTATMIGVGAHLAALVFLGVAGDPPLLEQARPGFVSIVSGGRDMRDPVVSEQLEFLNPEPLFIPTNWNAGVQPLPAELRRQPDQAFLSFDPQMTFSDSKLQLVFSPQSVALDAPVRALEIGGLPKYSAIGRKERVPISLDREAYVEVRRVSDGALVHTGPLAGLPNSIREANWAPVDFLVAINAAGMLGSPAIEVGSGSVEIDETFRGFLETKYRLGDRLSSGFYRVTVGP